MVDKVFLMLPETKKRNKVKQKAHNDWKKLQKEASEADKLFVALFGEEALEEPTEEEKRELFNEWFKEEVEKGTYDPNAEGANEVYVPRVNLDKFYNAAEGKFNFAELAKVDKSIRHNLLIDLFWNIMNTPEFAAQNLRPGGPGKIKTEAKVQEALKSIDTDLLAEKLGIKTDTNKLLECAKKLRTMESDDIQELINTHSKNAGLNPLSLSTQLYFHDQNATGGKMIGIYAVGVSAHSIGMWGDTHLRNPFYFMDYKLSKIDNSKDLEGSLIMESISGLLSGSVDNVKDPLLNSLMQNGDTANATIFLLRAGVPASVVFDFITSFNYKSRIEKADLAAAKKAVGHPTIEKLYEYKELKNKDKKEMPDAERLRFSQLDLVFRDLYNMVDRRANDLREITQGFRGDALSAAAGPTLGHNIVNILKMVKLNSDLSYKKGYNELGYEIEIPVNPEFTIDTNLIDTNTLISDKNYKFMLEDADKQNLPYIYTATKGGNVGTIRLLARIFPQLNEDLLSLIIDEENGLASYLSLTDMKADDAGKLVDYFLSDYALYQLGGTKFFGGKNQYETYRYFKEDFPSDFEAIRTKYKDVLNFNAFTSRLIVDKKGPHPRIKFTNSGNLTKTLKATITNDWAMLLSYKSEDYNPELTPEENARLNESKTKAINELGFKLFAYASCYGLHFTGGGSFIQLAPNVLRSAVSDYDSTIRNIDKLGNSKQFVNQFVKNHIHMDCFGVKRSSNSKSFHFIKDTNKFEYIAKTLPRLFTLVDDLGRQSKFILIDSRDAGKGNFIGTYEPVVRLGVRFGFKEYYYGVDPVGSIFSGTEMFEDSENEARAYGDMDFSNVYDVEDEFTAQYSDFLGEEGDYTEPDTPVITAYDSDGNPTEVC